MSLILQDYEMTKLKVTYNILFWNNPGKSQSDNWLRVSHSRLGSKPCHHSLSSVKLCYFTFLLLCYGHIGKGGIERISTPSQLALMRLNMSFITYIQTVKYHSQMDLPSWKWCLYMKFS